MQNDSLLHFDLKGAKPVILSGNVSCFATQQDIKEDLLTVDSVTFGLTDARPHFIKSVVGGEAAVGVY